MSSAIPVWIVPADQSQVSLVDEGSGLQGLVGGLVPEMPRGKPAQFIINQWEQLARPLALSLRQPRQNLSDFRHGSSWVEPRLNPEPNN
jgi:hypothetical protein